ncbi:MAG: hypothetical protein Q7S27_06905 [Nanoarchaeota archaeon]|nr:hypothetical protein [Nanoarchaeota archaeon]
MFKRKNYMIELIEYIKNNLKKGYTKDSLKWALISQGHSRLKVEKALKQVDIDLANQAPLLKTKPEIKYEVIEPKDYQPKEAKKSLWKRLFG